MQTYIQLADFPPSTLPGQVSARPADRHRWWVVAIMLAAAGLGVAAGLPWGLAWLLAGAPLVEEVIFRLGLQETLLRRLPVGREWAANVATALVFAGAHVLMRPGWMAAATLLPALALGLIYGRSRRLAPCVLLHALFNLAGIVLFGFPYTP